MSHTTSLSERLAQSIVEHIHASQLQPGDSLEPSRSLAERFEVTTPTIREALRRLEAARVVEMRHGSGVYVADGLTRSVMSNPHQPPITLRSILELADARLSLEPPIAARAAEHRTREGLSLLTQSASNALVDPPRRARPALHFHTQLAACTSNPLLEQTIEALLSQRMGEQMEIRLRFDDRERDYAEHLEILEAVRSRDADRAAELTRAHLQGIRDAIATSAPADPQDADGGEQR